LIIYYYTLQDRDIKLIESGVKQPPPLFYFLWARLEESRERALAGTAAQDKALSSA
jgi:hypothetical protein